MTKKDFVLIAHAIEYAPVANVRERQQLAEHFARLLSASNPRFDSARFVRAACPAAREVYGSDKPAVKLDAQGRDSDGNRREYW